MIFVIDNIGRGGLPSAVNSKPEAVTGIGKYGFPFHMIRPRVSDALSPSKNLSTFPAKWGDVNFEQLYPLAGF